ncbi:MAG: hypothetical protein DRN08_00830 [Thermoplasmata archaeon]|nr:MAG: hypothetical protein DRN08_00830 [Thermoplasmata archaeon]
MKIERRLMLIGVMLVVLSMTMATQYASTKIGYEYSIVHPSNADIRFIGSDNSSDGTRVLRVVGSNSTTARLKISLGEWAANQNKTYTAAFGIVNEEPFAVNITHINVSTTTGTDYLQIWLHGDRDKKAAEDASSVFMWDKGASKNGSSTTAWTLAAGNSNPSNMCADGSTQLNTAWDDTAGVRYSTNDANNSVSGTSDFVWVQISIDIPASPDQAGTHDGTIWIHFQATTIT